MPKIHKTVFASLERLILQVLDRKKADNSADTSDLENQIDQLVYQLYELTEEEIKIIETTDEYLDRTYKRYSTTEK